MTIRGTTVANNGQTVTSTGGSISIPSGSVEGEYMAVFVGCNVNSATAGVTGFATLNGPDTQGGVVQASMFGKYLDAADIAAGTVAITLGATAQRWVACAISFSNIDPAATAYVQSELISATNTTRTPPSVTTTADNEDVICFAVARVTNAAIPALSWSAAWTELNEGSTNFATSGANVTVGLAKIASPGAAGSYGGGTLTMSTTAPTVIYTVGFKNAPESQGWGVSR